MEVRKNRVGSDSESVQVQVAFPLVRHMPEQVLPGALGNLSARIRKLWLDAGLKRSWSLDQFAFERNEIMSQVSLSVPKSSIMLKLLNSSSFEGFQVRREQPFIRVLIQFMF